MSGWALALVFFAVFVGLAKAAGRRRPEMPPLEKEPTETGHPIPADGETAIRKVPRQVRRSMYDAPRLQHPVARPGRRARRRPPGNARRWL
jgi:hypothetical protein